MERIRTPIFEKIKKRNRVIYVGNVITTFILETIGIVLLFFIISYLKNN